MADTNRTRDLSSKGDGETLVTQTDAKDGKTERFVLEQCFCSAKVSGLVWTSRTGRQDYGIYVWANELVKSGGF